MEFWSRYSLTSSRGWIFNHGKNIISLSPTVIWRCSRVVKYTLLFPAYRVPHWCERDTGLTYILLLYICTYSSVVIFDFSFVSCLACFHCLFASWFWTSIFLLFFEKRLLQISPLRLSLVNSLLGGDAIETVMLTMVELGEVLTIHLYKARFFLCWR